MFSFLNNIPQVTKNLLLINILLYIISMVFQAQGFAIGDILGGHYLNSPLFKPFQIISHMFMHSLHDPLHIIFNMFLLVMFGAHLERIWGAKRFFIFYVSCGLGAFLLYNSIGVWEIMTLKKQLVAMGFDLDVLNNKITNGFVNHITYDSDHPSQRIVLQKYYEYSVSTMVGASGALFGILGGFAILFPNTELMLLFPPIPIKAKYLIGAYLIFEVYSSIKMRNDQIAHLAHVGGAIVGIALVLYWRRADKKNFW